MRCLNFEYDGLTLQDFGYIICSFNSLGVETISNGSNIEFNTVSTLNGSKHELINSTYGETLTATFQICKDLCIYNNKEEVSLEDMRDIMKWLNRKTFHKFKLLDVDGEYSGIYFDASFNVSKIELGGRLVGFELEMLTNRPFAVHEPVVVTIDSDVANSTKTIYSMSDEEGYIYPDMNIVVKEDGNLSIHNDFEDRTMVISNCRAGEVITINYPMITSSLASHKIQNDFNWQFFRIASSFKNKLNELTVSIPCTITMTYSPIVKVGI